MPRLLVISDHFCVGQDGTGKIHLKQWRKKRRFKLFSEQPHSKCKSCLIRKIKSGLPQTMVHSLKVPRKNMRGSSQLSVSAEAMMETDSIQRLSAKEGLLQEKRKRFVHCNKTAGNFRKSNHSGLVYPVPETLFLSQKGECGTWLASFGNQSVTDTGVCEAQSESSATCVIKKQTCSACPEPTVWGMKWHGSRPRNLSSPSISLSRSLFPHHEIMQSNARLQKRHANTVHAEVLT